MLCDLQQYEPRNSQGLVSRKTLSLEGVLKWNKYLGTLYLFHTLKVSFGLENFSRNWLKSSLILRLYHLKNCTIDHLHTHSLKYLFQLTPT